MIKGTGTDIIEIARIEQAVTASGRFAARVFTVREMAYCNAGKQRWARMAARFAAKEAVAKALGTGFGKVKWTDIEVMHGESGKPLVVLHGAASEIAANLDITLLSLSLSHCREYAVAFVIAS